MGDELIADLPEALEPAQGLAHASPCLAVAAAARAHMIEPEQGGPDVPLQVGGPRDVERRLEVRRGARVVAQALGADAGVPDHHQVLALVALVADAAGQLKRARVAADCRRGLGVREVRLATAVPGLHRDQVFESGALADLDRLLVEGDCLLVQAAAPRHCAEVIKRVGGVALVVHRARFRQRFGQARRRLFVGIGAPVGHAELDQRVTRSLTIATGARRIDDAANVGHRALRLTGLRACRPTPLVDRQALRLVQRLGMQLGQRSRAVQPVQGIAHRKQRLRALACEHQVAQRLRPGVSALEMLRQLGLAFVCVGVCVFVRRALAAAFQRFGNPLMQQPAPRPADVAIDHLANLVVAEVIDPTLGLLAPQVALDERLHRVEQRRLGLAGHVQQGVEVEAPAEHRGGLEQGPQRLGHMGKSHAHGGTQAVREQPRSSAGAGFELRLALAQGLQNRNQEKRVAFGFTMQALGQAGGTEV